LVALRRQRSVPAPGRHMRVEPRPQFVIRRNPPVASTTPARASTRTGPSCVSSTAPRTRPPSCSNEVNGARSISRTPRSNAESASSATSAFPFESRVPRGCETRSHAYRANSFPTCSAAAAERVIR
jgi:hypothetical protein